MKTFDLLGRVDEKGNLTFDYPVDFPAGPVRVVLSIIPFDEQAAEEDWREITASLWARDRSDPAEDIYEDIDGKPIDPGL